MALIVFSHGNSFPASTYAVLLELLRAQGHTVLAPEKFGHNPNYPVTSNWPYLVNELADFVREAQTTHAQAAYLVGHSLGGFLSVMVASQYPELARGVVLLDAPILGGWRAGVLGFAKLTGLIGKVSPGKISRQRRASWDSLASAHAHFAGKKLFATWDTQVLQDYVRLCTDEDAQGRRTLSFDPQVETAIYNTLPHNLDRLLKRSPLQCSVAFVGGKDSQEMQQVGMAMTQKIAKNRIQILAGTHLFPMEYPCATADAVVTALASLNVHD